MHVAPPPGMKEIVDRLAGLSRDLDRQTSSAEVLDRAAVEARHTFEIAFSGAFLRCEGPMDVRKHQSVIATEMEKLAAEIAEQKLRACRARIATIKMQIETGRSLSAALRAEISLTSLGMTP